MQDVGGFIGNLQYLGLNNVGMEPGPYSPVIPGLLYMVFQLVFATVTMAIVTSGFAERIKFSAYLVFALLWTTIVYDPLAHWVWGGGWASQFGAIDFAGGTVVHISSGFAALALALVIGKRVGYGKYVMEPANIPWSILGAALLWFGWFGFNSGSAVDANGLAALAFVTTNTAAAAGAMAWMLVSWVHGGKPSSLGFVSGAVAGLVAITPGAGYRDADGSDRYRCGGRCTLLRHHALAAEQRRRREPRCLGNPRHGRPLGCARNGYLCGGSDKRQIGAP